MAYDEELADRVRAVLAGEAGIGERRMMGGLVFLRDGNMLGGVDRDGLFVRVGAEAREELLRLGPPHVGPMGMGGRAPKGFVSIAPAGIEADDDLRRWLRTGLDFAASLPPKA